MGYDFVRSRIMYSDNFGVIEVAGARVTSAPGWAYVPDSAVGPAATTVQSNRKRARNQKPNPSGVDLSARQEAKIRKELEALDRDNSKDVNILIPTKVGGARSSKSTANVRKILQSQKTFGNHLDDYDASTVHTDNSPAPHNNQYSQKTSHPNQYTKRLSQPNQPTKRGTQPNQYTKRNTGTSLEGQEASKSRSRRGTRSEADPHIQSNVDSIPSGVVDVDMPDASMAGDDAIVAARDESSPRTANNPDSLTPRGSGYVDVLLQSVVPDLPTNEEIIRLLACTPSTYKEARANLQEQDMQYPVRRFCDVCGYWGKVRCLKCGTRVCALDCLEVHREDCFTRYGL